MRNDQAHEVIESAVDIPIVVHATKTQLLKHIIGLGCMGLLPGGHAMVDGAYRHRGHIHAATQLPQGGVAPGSFRKHGVDCAIYLDVQRMLHDRIGVRRCAHPSRGWH